MRYTAVVDIIDLVCIVFSLCRSPSLSTPLHTSTYPLSPSAPIYLSFPSLQYQNGNDGQAIYMEIQVYQYTVFREHGHWS